MRTIRIACSFFLFVNIALPIFAQQQMEFLNRGVYAINQGNGKTFISWRLLGNETSGVSFNIYRSAGNKMVKLNKQPLFKETMFIDETADTNKVNTYTISSIENGKEQ